jgi:hypothetical protein
MAADHRQGEIGKLGAQAVTKGKGSRANTRRQAVQPVQAVQPLYNRDTTLSYPP